MDNKNETQFVIDAVRDADEYLDQLQNCEGDHRLVKEINIPICVATAEDHPGIWDDEKFRIRQAHGHYYLDRWEPEDYCEGEWVVVQRIPATSDDGAAKIGEALAKEVA